MNIDLNPEEERVLAQRARELGYASAAEYVMELIKRETHPGEDRGWRAVRRLRGTAKGGLTADQIGEMTRSEV